MEKQEVKEEKKLPAGAVMSEEVAKAELEMWFDYRKMKPNARVNFDKDLEKDVMSEKMIEGFMFGQLSFNPENGDLTQCLDFHISNESKSVDIGSLVWKPRFKESDLTEPMKGIKTNDQAGRMKAYISAITGVSRLKLGSMDYSDFALSQTIVSYFLV